MKTFLTIRWARRVGLAPVVSLSLGLIVLALQPGCSTPGWGSWSVRPSPAQIAAALGRLDSYVYYPGYEIYYNRTKDRYVFREGRAWVTQQEPPEDVLGQDLQAAPSVAMSFNDAPERHHAAVVRNYPRYWGRPESLTALAH